MRTAPAGVAAVLAVALVVPITASEATTARAVALQEHRAAAHDSPAHHLQEGRRALDRAWAKADGDTRKQLAKLRADFAALTLAYTGVSPAPAKPERDAGHQAAGTSGTSEKPGRQGAASSGSEPTEQGSGVPPKTSGASPQPSATGTKAPAEWQVKYAEVERDFQALGPDQKDRSLHLRLDHAHTHLQMFYAAALGAPPPK